MLNAPQIQETNRIAIIDLEKILQSAGHPKKPISAGSHYEKPKNPRVVFCFWFFCTAWNSGAFGVRVQKRSGAKVTSGHPGETREFPPKNLVFWRPKADGMCLLKWGVCLKHSPSFLRLQDNVFSYPV